MKRNVKLLSILFVAGAFAACGGPQGEKAETGDSQEVTIKSGDVDLKLNVDESTIEWLGAKPTGEHNGMIKLQDGNVLLADGQLVGGKFVIDMNSIVNHDLEDAEDNAKLVGHLKSPDFFDVEKYPVSTFEITSVEPVSGNPDASHSITGNLTMKDVTKSITFPAMVEVDDMGVTAKSPVFLIDRTQWNVQYGSKTIFKELQDKFINDEIALNIKLVAMK